MPAARTLRPTLAALILFAFAPSLRAEPTKATWEPSRTTSPESVDELKALQAKVKTVVEKTTPSTVGLIVGAGAGSGVIVNEDGLVLTAAHVVVKPGMPILFVLSDGSTVRGKALGINSKFDSGMAKITDKPPKTAKWPGAADGKWPFSPMGNSEALKEGQWVVSLGHHGGPKKDRAPPVRLGRFEKKLPENRYEGIRLQTDCTLVGGDSGGPLFDLTGNVVGIHSKIGLFLNSNMHVPLATYKDEWDKLAKGEVVGKPPVDLGLVFDPDEESATVKEVTEDGPAAKAGVLAGDVVVRMNGEKVQGTDDVELLRHGLDPGQTVTLVVQRGEKTVTLKLTAGKRPRKE